MRKPYRLGDRRASDPRRCDGTAAHGRHARGAQRHLLPQPHGLSAG